MYLGSIKIGVSGIQLLAAINTFLLNVLTVCNHLTYLENNQIGDNGVLYLSNMKQANLTILTLGK